MRVLALDSTTRAGSVALLVDDAGGETLDERIGDATRTHAERLPADLLAVLDSHGLTAADVDLFAVSSGPGLFTGLRVGIAAMQGFALVSGKPLVAVSALDAVAQLAARDLSTGIVVGAWMNAHRRDVFSALFRLADAPAFDQARLMPIEGASVGDPRATMARWMRDPATVPAVLAGDGAELYRTMLAETWPGVAVFGPSPLAGAVARLARERFRGGERGGAASVQPLYVRRPDAELAREHALAHRAAHVDRAD
jgi:tRNA threonylcarbamoyladenosine biosynthesis protein TsaB